MSKVMWSGMIDFRWVKKYPPLYQDIFLYLYQRKWGVRLSRKMAEEFYLDKLSLATSMD